jgi:hypothetical protein
VNSLECGGWTPLFVVTIAIFSQGGFFGKKSGVKPPWTKAPSSRRTPKSCLHLISAPENSSCLTRCLIEHSGDTSTPRAQEQP